MCNIVAALSSIAMTAVNAAQVIQSQEKQKDDAAIPAVVVGLPAIFALVFLALTTSSAFAVRQVKDKAQ